MLNKAVFLSLIISLIAVIPLQSQELIDCVEREFLVEFPRINHHQYCLELPIIADSPAEQSYTSLIFDDEGVLYATYPYRGQVVALIDSDADALPDSEVIIADGLHRPNGLALYNDVLYVLGDGIVYTITEGLVETLIDDLPGGRGFIARGIVIHEDMLYIGIPSPCDYCEPDEPLQGTVIRMPLDASEVEVIAEGLRYPAGMTIYQDTLLVTDSARDAYNSQTAYDEINRIDLSSEERLHFGFPYCVGIDDRPDFESEFNCETAQAPLLVLASGTNPISLRVYEDDTFPHLSEGFMIVLAGSSNSGYISGHAIISVQLNQDDFLTELIVPVDNATTQLPSRAYRPYEQSPVLPHSEFVNNQAGGIFPHFPYDIAVSPEGWLYFSVSGKGIYVLRPRT